MQRIKPVEGNMQELRVGISAANYAEIIENVQIVLHSAADVRFDETLKHLLMVNLRGTREVLALAAQMKRLEVVIHISTAYSHCPRHHIEEKFYAAPMDPDDMIRIAEQFAGDDERDFEVITSNLIRPWPNTYTFTKSLAEELVRRFGEHYPIALIRPSIGKIVLHQIDQLNAKFISMCVA